MATAQATTDHDEIRNWVEGRGGHPARVKDTGSRNDPGVLRIDFPGFSGEDTLEEIEWEEFFEWFDRNDLAVLLSDEKGNRFNKIVSRDTAVEAPAARSAKKAVSSKKASATKRTKRTNTTKRTSAKKVSSKKASAKKASAKKASAKKASPTRRRASAKTSRTTSRKKPSAKK